MSIPYSMTVTPCSYLLNRAIAVSLNVFSSPPGSTQRLTRASLNFFVAVHSCAKIVLDWFGPGSTYHPQNHLKGWIALY